VHNKLIERIVIQLMAISTAMYNKEEYKVIRNEEAEEEKKKKSGK